METMRRIVMAACMVSVLTGVIQALKPNHRFDRQIRFFTACLFVMAVAMPLLRGIQAFQPDAGADTVIERCTDQLQEETGKQAISLAQAEVEQMLREELAAQGIPCSQLTVEMHIDADDSINMKRVSVISTLPEQAQAALRQYLGKDVEIIADDKMP